MNDSDFLRLLAPKSRMTSLTPVPPPPVVNIKAKRNTIIGTGSKKLGNTIEFAGKSIGGFNGRKKTMGAGVADDTGLKERLEKLQS